MEVGKADGDKLMDGDFSELGPICTLAADGDRGEGCWWSRKMVAGDGMTFASTGRLRAVGASACTDSP